MNKLKQLKQFLKKAFEKKSVKLATGALVVGVVIALIAANYPLLGIAIALFGGMFIFIMYEE